MGEINTNMFKKKCVNLVEIFKSALLFLTYILLKHVW